MGAELAPYARVSKLDGYRIAQNDTSSGTAAHTGRRAGRSLRHLSRSTHQRAPPPSQADFVQAMLAIFACWPRAIFIVRAKHCAVAQRMSMTHIPAAGAQKLLSGLWTLTGGSVAERGVRRWWVSVCL